MRFFDAFSGYGGFHLGIERAYDFSNKQLTKIKQDGKGRNGNANKVESDVLPTSRTTPLCVGYSEIDKYASAVYKKQFGGGRDESIRRLQPKGDEIEQDSNNTKDKLQQRKLPNNRGGGQYAKNFGDITKIKADELPDFDLLTGGVPCQSWSIAGKRGGFQDERGSMWSQYCRILKAKQPKFFIAENVKGLLSHDGGKSMEKICEMLCESGYALDFDVLNAKNFGVPQNRERVFIVGIRLDLLDKCQLF